MFFFEREENFIKNLIFCNNLKNKSTIYIKIWEHVHYSTYFSYSTSFLTLGAVLDQKGALLVFAPILPSAWLGSCLKVFLHWEGLFLCNIKNGTKNIQVGAILEQFGATTIFHHFGFIFTQVCPVLSCNNIILVCISSLDVNSDLYIIQKNPGAISEQFGAMKFFIVI